MAAIVLCVTKSDHCVGRGFVPTPTLYSDDQAREKERERERDRERERERERENWEQELKIREAEAVSREDALPCEWLKLEATESALSERERGCSARLEKLLHPG